MENFNENKNNNLENQGWEAMRFLLDKELPEVAATPLFLDEKKKENKRRFLLFFFLFLGLCSTGLGYYFYAQKRVFIEPKSSFENNKIIVTKTDKIASNNKENFAKNDKNTEGPLLQKKYEIDLEKTLIKSNKATNNSSDYTNIVIKKNNLQNIENQLVTSKLNVELNTNSVITTELKNEYKIEYNALKNDSATIRDYTVYIDKKNTNTDTILNKQNLLFKQEKNNLLEEKETQYEGKNRLITSTDLIDILTPKPIYFEEKKTIKKDDNLFESLTKINSRKWSYGLILGINTEGPLNTMGGVGGIFLEKNLNAKWSVSTGLNYRVLTKDVASKNVAGVEYFQTAADATSKSTTSQSTSFVKVNSAYLQNLNYVELPIQINHRIGRKLTVFSGLKMGYLVAQYVYTNQMDNALYLSTSSVYGGSLSGRIINAKDYTSNDLGLQKWDIGWLGGVNYRLNQRFSLQLRYDLGLTNIYQTEAVGFYNRFVGINVAYGFNRTR